MIKRTILISNPCYLKKKLDQLVVEYANPENQTRSVPIEDVGIVILDHHQITITQALLLALNQHNVALLNCNEQHMPLALMLPLYGHHTYTEKVKVHLQASLPLKKNLWQQTIVSKINNQAACLEWVGADPGRLYYLSKLVKSGDPENVEGRAASHYWNLLFDDTPQFKRHRFGDAPNNLLNYGYAILRSVVARALVASGMLPAVGIFHRNKYNPYCLADDIMEPYRPFVDKRVMQICESHTEIEDLTKELKQELLSIPVMDVLINGEKSPLMIAAGRTAASVMQCFEGVNRKVLYPEFINA